MEVRVNKDIQEYKESMFFGLTLRQFFFSALGCVAAVVLYFLFKDKLGLEITTWICVIGTVPFAAMGFLKYNGMTAEQFAVAWLKAKVIYPKKYLSEPVSIYYRMMEDSIAQRQGSLTKKALKKRSKRGGGADD